MIRVFVLFSVLFALGQAALSSAHADGDPGDRFLRAYFLIQEGDTAESAGNWTTAHAKYTSALTIITDIKSREPDWHPTLVEFRSQYCKDHLTALTPKLSGNTPAPSTVTKPVEPPPVQSETEQINQLKSQLQQSKDEVRQLNETRERLSAQLATLLKEPAPTDRSKTREMLDELKALRAANESNSARLAEAEAKAVKAGELSNQLTASQKKIQELEAGRDQLNVKLQAALSQVSSAQTNPQIEELIKKNSDVTAQLAEARSEITKLRDQVLATPAADLKAAQAETLKLRADLSSTRSELDQTKTLLSQRTQELTLTRGELDKAKAENIQLVKTQGELIAKLNDSDRQLRAAKAAGEKDDQIIQQLHKENDLLHEIAARQNAKSAQAKGEDSGGFLWFRRKTKPANVIPPVTTNMTVTATPPSAPDPSRLTATVKAPAATDAAKADAERIRATAAAAVDNNDGSSEIRLLQAQAKTAIDAKDFNSAKTYLTAAVAKDPRNVTSLLNLGTTLYQLNQLDEAADMLRKALAIEPNQGKSRSILGVIQLRKGRIDDAYNELTRAVAIDPRNAEAHNYLGIVMSEKGWVTAGEQEIRRAIELKPDYADAHFNLAVIYTRERTPRLELARYHYAKSTELGAARDPQLETLLKPATIAETPKTQPVKILP